MSASVSYTNHARTDEQQTRLDQHLLITGPGRVTCARCAHDLGPQSENYKLHAVRKDRPIQEANPCIVDPRLFIDRTMVFRQFYCPGCATLLENEVVLAESEPTWDKELR